jgi:hypothetical protein
MVSANGFLSSDHADFEPGQCVWWIASPRAPWGTGRLIVTVVRSLSSGFYLVREGSNDRTGDYTLHRVKRASLRPID